MEHHAVIDWLAKNWIELAGSTMAALCVFFYIKENVWSWPTGLVQTVFYTWIFFDAKLYSDFILQLINIVLIIYGWYYWVHPPVNKVVLPITRMKLREAGVWVAVTIIGTVAVGYLMKTYTDAALPYWDAAIAVMSLIAQYLIARKVLENWLIWIVVDIVAIGVYYAKDLRLTSGLYAVFLVMATLGFLAWRKSYKQARSPECASPITPAAQPTP
jgi:nicotinamide mononucleotide transporter